MLKRKNSSAVKYLPLSKQIASLKDVVNGLNLKTKKKEQLLEMVDNIEKTVTQEIGVSNTDTVPKPEGMILSLPPVKKKNKRRIWKTKSEECRKVKEPQPSLLRNRFANKTDSLQNLHLFLENRAAQLSLPGPTNTAYEQLQMRVKPLVIRNTVNGSPFSCLCGPDDRESEDRYASVASAQTISTYPKIPEFGRSGDPICDRFYVQLYKETSIITLADGCNWGDKPREAAILACNEIVSFMASRMISCTTTPDIGSSLLKAFNRAHEKIISTKDICYEAGTTTVLAGVLTKLEHPEEEGKEWVFVCVSVGDCKAFYYSMKNKTFVDITVGNRLNLTDARDCGGRLGPASESGSADLRNLMSYYATLDPGDIVVVVSDGIHDNLDPQLRGESPTKFGIDAETWEEAEEKFVEEANFAKSKYLIDAMNTEIHSSGEPVTPHLITSSLIILAKNVTKACREFMESSLGARQPVDYVKYPGKMDHTSCVCVKAQAVQKHPFATVAEVIKQPGPLSLFKEYLEKEEILYPDNFFELGPASLEDKKKAMSLDIAFLRDIYMMDTSVNHADYISAVLKLYSSFRCPENEILLADFVEEQFSTHCKNFIEQITRELEKRVGNVFQKFKLSQWMKHQCFSELGL